MHHPEPQTLHDYVTGKLPQELADEVERHFTLCSSCEETVDRAELPREADAFVQILLSPEEPDPFEDEPSLEQMLAKVDRLVRAGNDKTGDSRIEIGSVPVPEQPPPRGLGEYDVGEALGSGGMGTVYRGFHRRLRRPVAIKLLKSDRLQDASAVERFEREMAAVGRVEHAHIVRALDAGETDGTLYLAMELADGLSLAEVAARRGPLDAPNACEAVRQAALGIAAAHRAGMTHRDVKPGNLILARVPSDEEIPHAVVKVLDLGLARFHEPTAPGPGELTSAGQIMGTVDYMAPEQAVSSHDVGPPADVYALGATLYRLLTGRAPLDAPGKANAVQRLAALASRSAPPIRQLRADLPPALAELLDRTLSRDPGERPAASELAKLLQPFAANADLFALLVASEAAGTSAASLATATSMTGSVDSTGGSFMAGPSSAADPSGVPPTTYARFWSLAAAVGLLPLILGIVFFLQTPQGTIRVEIDDPDIEVRVKDGGLLLKGIGQEETTLATGRQGLLVTRGELSFETSKLLVKRGETVVVKVERIDGSLLATANGYEIGRGTLPREPAEQGPVDTPQPTPIASGADARDSALDAFRREEIPHDQLVVLGGGDPDAAPHEVVAVFGDGRFGPWASFSHPAVSPDGSLLATNSWPYHVTLWETESGLPVRTLAGHLWGTERIAFVDEGRRIVSGGGGPSDVCLHDVRSGRLLWRSSGSAGAYRVRAIGVRSEDRAILIGTAGDRGGGVDILKPESGERTGGFELLGRGRSVAGFDAEGRVAVVFRDGDEAGIELREAEGGKILHEIPGRFSDGAVAFSPGNDAVAVAPADASGKATAVVVWSLETAKESERFALPEPMQIKYLAFDPHGDVTAIGEGACKIRPGSKEIVHRIRRASETMGCLSPDGSKLYLSAGQGPTAVYDWRNEGTATELSGTIRRLDSAALSDDGTRFAASYETTLRERSTEVRDVLTDRLLFEAPVHCQAWKFLPAGGLLGFDPFAPLVVLNDEGAQDARFDSFYAAQRAGRARPAVSDDGNFVAVEAAGKLAVLRVSDGTVRWKKDLEEPLRALAYSSDGSCVAATLGHEPGAVAVWNAETGEFLQRLEAPAGTRQLHWIEFQPRGRGIGAAHVSGLLLWNFEQGWEAPPTCRQVTTGGDPYCDSFAFDPLRERIVAAWLHGVLVWDFAEEPPALEKTVDLSQTVGRVREVAFADDGRHVLAMRENGTAVVLRIDDRPTLPEPGETALLLDGSRSVTAPAEWDGSTPLTLEAWVGCDAVREGEILSCAHLRLAAGGKRTTFGSGRSLFDEAVGLPLRRSEMVHVAGVYEEGFLRLYVEGRLQAVQARSAGLPPTPTTFAIGGAADGLRGFRGLIDEVRISSTARYDGDFEPERRLAHDDRTIALYRMDEGSGDALFDSSGAGRHVTTPGLVWRENR